MQLYSDSVAACTDPAITTRDACVPPPAALDVVVEASHTRQLKGGGGGGIDFEEGDIVAWVNPAFGSFDDFGSAMLLLYIMSTGDGWEEVMYVGMDAVEPGIAPRRTDASLSSLFFIMVRNSPPPRVKPPHLPTNHQPPAQHRQPVAHPSPAPLTACSGCLSAPSSR